MVATPNNERELRAEYLGERYVQVYRRDGEFDYNSAWEAIANLLPQGKPGDEIELSDGAGCHDGGLRWNGDDWEYIP